MNNFDHQENLFSTPIWGYMLNTEKYHSKDYIEYILNLRNTEKSQQKSNMGGYQTRDDLENEGVFQELIKILNGIGNSICQNYTNKPVKVISMWGNINEKYCFNAAHTHEGLISGVLYLEVPENSGRLVFCNPAVRSDTHPIKQKNYAIVPQKLACILFPSWLEHYVEPNMSDSTRISISFNIGEK